MPRKATTTTLELKEDAPVVEAPQEDPIKILQEQIAALSDKLDVVTAERDAMASQAEAAEKAVNAANEKLARIEPAGADGGDPNDNRTRSNVQHIHELESGQGWARGNGTIRRDF